MAYVEPTGAFADGVMVNTRSMKRCWFCFAFFPAIELVDYTLVGDENTTVKVCVTCKARRTR